jgi:hypothetical protein
MMVAMLFSSCPIMYLSTRKQRKLSTTKSHHCADKSLFLAMFSCFHVETLGWKLGQAGAALDSTSKWNNMYMLVEPMEDVISIGCSTSFFALVGLPRKFWMSTAKLSLIVDYYHMYMLVEPMEDAISIGCSTSFFALVGLPRKFWMSTVPLRWLG